MARIVLFIFFLLKTWSNKMNFVLHPLAFSIITLIVGILILVFPRILNYIVGIYLLIVGILGLISYFS